ncbi:FG-GAP repeat protein [Thermodesulfatator indicus DSM 15286]|uniref:FG-GAP repeat protein n=1 Tax=Thermodesulfatator indicus (strain DSM 15286 / JCM 11887 / CIR29812) TaxID=667014 RepID=F8AC69_THEID|nr:VCBS repeat-containing protein [Thermodesulfatator indicus]AEH44628.1 FG-GAP repeat protein [Thermodesulfatator indicus DSM 15286]
MKFSYLVKFMMALMLFFSFSFDVLAQNDPLKKRRIISDVELIIGDVSKDGLQVFDYRNLSYGKNRAVRILDKQLFNKFDRNDTVICGNVAANFEDEIIIAFGKKRENKNYAGQIVAYAPDMHVIYSTLAANYERDDGLAAGYLEKNSKGYDYIVLGSRARDTLEVWSFKTRSRLASINVGYEKNDKIATGDVNGDGIDEIIMGDASENKIKVFFYNPKVRRVLRISNFSGKGIFNIDDRLSAGDVDGDGIDEIVFLNNDGTIYFYDMKGNLKGKPFKVKYDKYSQMAVGDINRDGYEDIIVAYAKDDIVRVYDYRGRIIAQKIDPDFERYDSLAVGDIDGNSVVVGSPKVGKVTTRIEQIVAIINAPPKEKALIRKDGSYFYASFDRVTELENGLKVEAKEGVLITRDSKMDAPLIDLMDFKVRRIFEKSTSTISEKVTTKTIGYGLKADRYDTAITIKTTYKIFAYPILFPKEIAFENGERQYVLIYVPVDIEVTDIDTVPQYISSTHVTGYVASYPERKSLLYNYLAKNEIGSLSFNVMCDSRYLKIGLSEANIQVTQDKRSSQLKMDKKDFFDMVRNVIPGMSSKTKKTYTNEKITTHTISFTESTVIGVHLKENAFNYCLTEEGYDTQKYKYKVGVVVYYDKDRGYLVVDYYVPEKTPYFKDPPKLAPLAPFILKDGKLLLKLKPIDSRKPIKKLKLKPLSL